MNPNVNITDSDVVVISNDDVARKAETWYVSDALGSSVVTHYAAYGGFLGYGSTPEEADANLVQKVEMNIESSVFIV